MKTVGDWLDRLQQFDPALPLRLCTKADNELVVGCVYTDEARGRSYKNPNAPDLPVSAVWIDLDEKKRER